MVSLAQYDDGLEGFLGYLPMLGWAANAWNVDAVMVMLFETAG